MLNTGYTEWNLKWNKNATRWMIMYVFISFILKCLNVSKDIANVEGQL